MGEGPSVYDFCGARLTVESEEPSLAAAFRGGFGRFQSVKDRTGADGFHLRIVAGQPVLPARLPLVWSGLLPEGGNARLFEDEERCVLIVDGACSLDVDLRASSASVVVAPRGMGRFMGSPSIVLLDFVLRVGRQWLIHAACLVNPRSNRAILVFGPSGLGKTTTALALARGGFGLMTDDAAVFGQGLQGVSAWGMPRDLKVHHRSAELLSWIGPVLGGAWDAKGEQPIRLAAIEERIALRRPEPQPLEAIVILGERTGGQHRLERIEKRAALLMIAADNVPWYPTGVPGRARESFEALAGAVRAVPTFRLNAGPGLDTLPGLFADRLEQAGSVAEQDR